MLLGICQGHFYEKARLYLRLASDKACFYTLFRCYSPNFALWIVAVISLCHTPTRNAVSRQKRGAFHGREVDIFLHGADLRRLLQVLVQRPNVKGAKLQQQSHA